MEYREPHECVCLFGCILNQFDESGRFKQGVSKSHENTHINSFAVFLAIPVHFFISVITASFCVVLV